MHSDAQRNLSGSNAIALIQTPGIVDFLADVGDKRVWSPIIAAVVLPVSMRLQVFKKEWHVPGAPRFAGWRFRDQSTFRSATERHGSQRAPMRVTAFCN